MLDFGFHATTQANWGTLISNDVPAAGFRLVLLVDHDNMPSGQFSLEAVIRRWLQTLQPSPNLPGVVEIHVRAYGGWFEESASSAKRYEAHDFYQARCPAVLHVSNIYFRITFAFADDLLASRLSLTAPGSVRITHTVSNRTSKKDFLINKSAPTCPDPTCEISDVRRWLRLDAACLKKQCPARFANVFVRKEQKQVDIHLAMDLLALAMGKLNRPNETLIIGIVSDDIDFIPAVAAAMQVRLGRNNISVIRFTPKGAYLDQTLMASGVSLVSLL